MSTRRIDQIWEGRDSDRRFYRVRDGEHDAADDDRAAIVVVSDNEAQCYRCDTKANIEFKCVHIHTVRRELDI